MNKLGTYIEKLMVTILDKEQDDFVVELAMSELNRLNVDIQDFIFKNKKDDEKASEKTIKTLLQEEKQNGKNTK